jgi:hypothetical protein
MASPADTQGSWVVDEDELWFSDRFNVDPAALEEHRAYDISVATDTPCWPTRSCCLTARTTSTQALHEQMLDYLRFLKEKASLPLPEGLVQNWFALHEVNRTGSGSPKTATLAMAMAMASAPASRGIYATRSRTCCATSGRRPSPTPATWRGSPCYPTAWAATPSVTSRPTSSSTICALTPRSSPRSTSTPSCATTFAVTKKTESWATRQYVLPRLGKDFVLLTPIYMLTKDETWINRPEVVIDTGTIRTA